MLFLHYCVWMDFQQRIWSVSDYNIFVLQSSALRPRKCMFLMLWSPPFCHVIDKLRLWPGEMGSGTINFISLTKRKAWATHWSVVRNLQVCTIHTDPLHWRHSDHDSVSNHQPHGCLVNRVFRRRSKKTSKLSVTGLCVRNSPGPVNKGPVTREMLPFDDVIMNSDAIH